MGRDRADEDGGDGGGPARHSRQRDPAGSVKGPRIDRVFEAEAAQKGMTVAAIREGYAAGTALRSLVDPEDVAEMAWFLASPAAKMVTGQAIAVDGFTINPDPQV